VKTRGDARTRIVATGRIVVSHGDLVLEGGCSPACQGVSKQGKARGVELRSRPRRHILTS